MSHNDVSVTQLKSHYLYSLPENIIPDIAKQKQIKQFFQSIRHEVVGIHIDQGWYNQIPIHDSTLPDDYQQLEHVVKCVNYPDSDQVYDFDPYILNLDDTVSQLQKLVHKYLMRMTMLF